MWSIPRNEEEAVLNSSQVDPREAAEVADRTLDALWSALDESLRKPLRLTFRRSTHDPRRGTG